MRAMRPFFSKADLHFGGRGSYQQADAALRTAPTVPQRPALCPSTPELRREAGAGRLQVARLSPATGGYHGNEGAKGGGWPAGVAVIFVGRAHGGSHVPK